MDRRKYIKYFLYAFILIVIFFFGRIFNFIKKKFFSNANNTKFSNANNTKIARINDFNEKNFLKINETEIIIRKNNTFYLINLICPHEGCLVKYNNNELLSSITFNCLKNYNYRESYIELRWKLKNNIVLNINIYGKYYTINATIEFGETNYIPDTKFKNLQIFLKNLENLISTL